MSTERKVDREQRQLADLMAWRLPRQLSMDVWISTYESVIDRWTNGNLPEVDVTSVVHYARRQADKATAASMYDGLPSWKVMRRLIYLRDDGICWGCGAVTTWPSFQLGHLIDRMIGGFDIPENLAVMCDLCNTIKPLTFTIEEAVAWRDAGGGTGQIIAGMDEAIHAHPREFAREV